MSVAFGTTDIGNTVPVSAASLPLPTGAATEATLTSLNAKLNSLGQNSAVNSVPVVIASNQTDIPLKQYGPNSNWIRVSGNATTVIKSGAGFLRRIIKTAGGNVTMYDNTAGSGTIIHIITGTNPQGTITYDIPFSVGLTIVTTSGPDLVLVYD